MRHQSKLEFDNPIELEKLPARPLSFELVATPDEETPLEPFLHDAKIVAMIVSVPAILGVVVRPYVVDRFPILAGLTFLLALILIAWTILRPRFAHPQQWWWGLALASLLAMFLAATGVAGTRLGCLACAALFYYAVCEFTFHWWSMHWRYRNPTRPDWDEAPFPIVEYQKQLLPATLAGGLIAMSWVSPWTWVIVTVAIVLMVKTAWRQVQSRGLRPFRFMKFALRAWLGYPYPESDTPIPGLMTTPVGPRNFRLIPSALYLGASFGGALAPTVTLWPEAAEATASFMLIVLGQIAIALMIGPGLLLVNLALVASRLAGKPPQGIPAIRWYDFIDSLRKSSNPHERDALYHGTVAADGSPVLVHRKLYREHVHYLGDSGGGKTSLGLSPTIEQLVSFADSSVVICDLKGDTLEMLASAEAARDRAYERTGIKMPIRYFTLDDNQPTYVFNPLTSKAWSKLTPLQRADVLCSACGLDYGSSYGRAFFSAGNFSVVRMAERMNRGELNFRSLHREIAKLLTSSAGQKLPQALRNAGVHAHDVFGRLAAIKQLNVVPGEPGSEHSIDLTDCYTTPQILYFQFPTTIAAGSAAAVARMATYFLMVAGKSIRERKQVYVVIDEFQRMASDNLDALFQMARSYDISLIIANQSIEDLGAQGSKLLNVIETTCHLRQWFSVSGRHDLNLVQMLAGTRDKLDVTTTVRSDGNGSHVSQASRVKEVARLTVDNLLYVSTQKDLSVLRVTGARSGYAHYQGLPMVVRSQFHITQKQFEQRARYQWPSLQPGMILSEELPFAELGDSDQQGKPHKPNLQSPPDDDDIEFSDWTVQ